MPAKSRPPKFDSDIYSRITLNDLVIYSVYYLHRQGTEITSEDIISACFVLFPKRFSLKKYPDWPDSAVVNRRWSECRKKGYLLGNNAKGFKLSAKGFKRVEILEKQLGGTRPVTSNVHVELTSRAGRFIRSMEASDAYAHYKKKTEINEFDFRSLLLCTMESPPATLAGNLEQFKEYADVYKRKDLLTFLEFCEDKFSHLLGTTTPAKRKLPKSKSKYRKASAW